MSTGFDWGGRADGDGWQRLQHLIQIHNSIHSPSVPVSRGVDKGSEEQLFSKTPRLWGMETCKYTIAPCVHCNDGHWVRCGPTYARVLQQSMSKGRDRQVKVSDTEAGVNPEFQVKDSDPALEDFEQNCNTSPIITEDGRRPFRGQYGDSELPPWLCHTGLCNSALSTSLCLISITCQSRGI